MTLFHVFGMQLQNLNNQSKISAKLVLLHHVLSNTVDVSAFVVWGEPDWKCRCVFAASCAMSLTRRLETTQHDGKQMVRTAGFV